MHLLGIYSVISCRQKSNQLLILLNLSCVEVLATVYNIANDGHRIIKYKNSTFEDIETIQSVFSNDLPPFYHETSFIFFCMTAFELQFVYLTLVIDRFISIITPFRYKVFVTRRRLRFTVMSTWALSVIFGVLYGVVPDSKTPLIISFIFVATVYFIATILTYSIVIWKQKSQIRVNYKRSQNATQSQIQFKKHYRIPTLIILTYFVLYVTPFGIQRFYIRRLTNVSKSMLALHECLSIVIDLGMISDVIIYVFLTPYLRAVITKHFVNCRRSVQNTLISLCTIHGTISRDTKE